MEHSDPLIRAQIGLKISCFHDVEKFLEQDKKEEIAAKDICLQMFQPFYSEHFIATEVEPIYFRKKPFCGFRITLSCTIKNPDKSTIVCHLYANGPRNINYIQLIPKTDSRLLLDLRLVSCKCKKRHGPLRKRLISTLLDNPVNRARSVYQIACNQEIEKFLHQQDKKGKAEAENLYLKMFKPFYSEHFIINQVEPIYFNSRSCGFRIILCYKKKNPTDQIIKYYVHSKKPRNVDCVKLTPKTNSAWLLDLEVICQCGKGLVLSEP